MNYALLDELIDSIKKEDVYKNYIKSYQKIQNDEEISSLLKQLHQLLEKQEELSKYSSYINLDDINQDIKKLRKELYTYQDIQDYQNYYSQLEDYLDDITYIIFHGISVDIQLGRMGKLYARHSRTL